MQINPYLRKELVTGMQFCAKKIMEEQDLRRKMYFHERIPYEISKILEINYDKQLAFIQFVLEVSQSTIADRVASIVGEDNTIPMIDGIFEGIVKNLNELARKIEKDEDTYKTLEDIAELSYLSTASGYHQYLRGMVKP